MWAAAALASALGAAAALPGAAPSPCLTGAFKSASGSLLVLTLDRSPESRRFVLEDGRTGVLRPTTDGSYEAGPGWSDATPVVARATMRGCRPKRIGFDIEGGPRGTWSRIVLRETAVRFNSGDAKLQGRWVRPERAGAAPAVVLVHGSSDTPYVDHEPWQWMLPAMGVAIFIYNKRGTGDSGGSYTQDFSVLADDAAAAIRATRELRGAATTRLGVLGLSQGGWVAPLAALRAPVDFVQVNYGVVGTPLEQDRWQVRYELTQAGFGAQALAEADLLTAAAAEVAASDFRDHLDYFNAVLKRFKDRAWLHRFEGQYTGLLVRGAVDQARAESPQVPWHLDSSAALTRLTVPQFWIMAADDSLAPSAPSIARLAALRAAGLPIEVAVFPGTDHGIREFRTTAEGRRRTRWADRFFRLEADWILGRVSSPYGGAQFLTASLPD